MTIEHVILDTIDTELAYVGELNQPVGSLGDRMWLNGWKTGWVEAFQHLKAVVNETGLNETSDTLTVDSELQNEMDSFNKQLENILDNQET